MRTAACFDATEKVGLGWRPPAIGRSASAMLLWGSSWCSQAVGSQSDSHTTKLISAAPGPCYSTSPPTERAAVRGRGCSSPGGPVQRKQCAEKGRRDAAVAWSCCMELLHGAVAWSCCMELLHAAGGHEPMHDLPALSHNGFAPAACTTLPLPPPR